MNFEQIIKDNKANMFAQALKIMKDREDAKDVVQDALVLFWRNANNFRGDCKVSTYLYGAVKHAALAQLRKRRRYAKKMAAAQKARATNRRPETPEELLEASRLAAKLSKAVERMPKEALEALVLCTSPAVFIGGVELHRLPVIKSRLHRARSALRRKAFGRTDLAI